MGTSLDKMITMQAQMEHFATSLEGMHDTVTTCQVVLSQLVDGTCISPHDFLICVIGHDTSLLLLNLPFSVVDFEAA